MILFCQCASEKGDKPLAYFKIHLTNVTITLITNLGLSELKACFAL